MIRGLRQSLLTIGLTGGIASGKSHVALDLEQKRGARRLDADKLAHALYVRDTPTYNAIVKAFGDQVVRKEDGEIDRRALGSIVFADKDQVSAPVCCGVLATNVSALSTKRCVV